MGTEVLSIEVLDEGGVARALAFYAATGFPYKPDDEAALRAGMASGNWTFVMAVQGKEDIGGFYLNRAPKYHVYKRIGLPEMQDLRVLPGHRRKGVATALIAYAEAMAHEGNCRGLGISVGLYADYGAAQRLYARLGYVPDGNGVTYDRQPVAPGEKLPVDDDLALMLVKFF